MRSDFESRETFECILGGEDGIDLSKDETGEYSFQPTRFAYSFFLVAWQHQQTKVDELNQELHLVLNNWNDLTRAIHARTNGTAVAEARQLHEKVGELQKLVDAAQKLIDDWNCGGVNLFDLLDELEQALNGGLDE